MSQMIVNCVSYADGKRMGPVELEDISEILRFEGQFIWIGLHEPDEDLLRKIQEEFGLHDLAVEDAHRAHQRPKIEEYGDSLFVVLRTAQTLPGSGEVAFGETHVFLGPRYVVTVRHGASLSYAAVRQRCETAPDLLRQGPGFVLYAIMDFVVDQYFPIIDELEEELGKLEEQIFDAAQRGRENTESVYRLKQEILAVKRAIVPLIDVCNRLVRFDRMLIRPETRLYFRDVYDHVVRINETIDSLRELLTGALESNLALIGIRQNETMQRLASYAALVAVPTLIAGVYGMNFKFMPELDWKLGYPMSLGLMVGICGYLVYRFRKAGWL
ncbi:MAG TPA: magnesium/cobalt transporter CorA [Candidatus Binatia bacterium]|nr:magnesium/cobalt transporter CorA [Candidatus Binatia bacterium]